jgi:O-antigen ligase/Flp pilus assembly protein TadD
VPGEPSAGKLQRRGFLALGIILYFTFIGGSFYSDLHFPLRVFNQAAVTALLGAWLVRKWRRGEAWPRTPLDAPLLAWLALHFATALLGLSPRFSLEKLWTPLTHALALYLLVDLRRKGQTALVVRGLYLSAGVVCLIGLVEFASWYLGLPLLPGFVQGWPEIGGLRDPFPPTLYRLNFTLNGATPLSAYLALLIPPALGMLLTSRRPDDRQAIAAWLVLAVIVEGLSMSRGGLLALMVSLPLLGAGWWLAHRQGGQVFKRLRAPRTLRRPAVIGLLAAVTLLAAFTAPTWLERTFNRAASTQFRFTLWQVALDGIREHPLTGVGPYNFGRSLLRRNDPLLPRRQIMTAHNVYLNSVAEMGLAGLLAGGWLLLAAGRAWLVRWRSASEPGERVRVAAAGAALAGLAAQSLVDTFPATPNVLPLLAVTAFALTRRTVPAAARADEASRQASVSKLPIAAGLAALLLFAAGLAWLDLAQFHFQRSIRLAGQDKLAEAAQAAGRARRLDPALPLYTFQEAYVQGSRSDDPGALASAANLFRTGLAVEPVGGRQAANLAAVRWAAGDWEGTIDALHQAVSVERDPTWLVNLGYLYQEAGDVDGALEAYSQALALAPHLAGSEFWTADPQRAELWPAILARAETDRASQPINLLHWRLGIASARGDWSAAVQWAGAILKDVPTDCESLALLARSRLRASQAAEAAQLAGQALAANPACASGYWARGLARQAAGDPAGAEADLRTALFLGHTRAAYSLGQLNEARGDQEAAGRFYAMGVAPSAIPTDVEVVLYNRQATFDLLPPLFRIGVGPEQAEALLALGGWCERQGDQDCARRVYRALLAEDRYLGVARQRLRVLGEDE